MYYTNKIHWDVASGVKSAVVYSYLMMRLANYPYPGSPPVYNVVSHYGSSWLLRMNEVTLIWLKKKKTLYFADQYTTFVFILMAQFFIMKKKASNLAHTSI